MPQFIMIYQFTLISIHLLPCNCYFLPFHYFWYKNNHLSWLLSCYYCIWHECNLNVSRSYLQICVNMFIEPNELLISSIWCVALTYHRTSLWKQNNPINQRVKRNEIRSLSYTFPSRANFMRIYVSYVGQIANLWNSYLIIILISINRYFLQ